MNYNVLTILCLKFLVWLFSFLFWNVDIAASNNIESSDQTYASKLSVLVADDLDVVK